MRGHESVGRKFKLKQSKGENIRHGGQDANAEDHHGISECLDFSCSPIPNSGFLLRWVGLYPHGGTVLLKPRLEPGSALGFSGIYGSVQEQEDGNPMLLLCLLLQKTLHCDVFKQSGTHSDSSLHSKIS